MAKPENMDILTSSSLTSLHSYVGEIPKSTNMKNIKERMKNEWARYITFGSFPQSSPVQPTRLARSGFYYSGTGDETICFSCALRYRNWKESDSPFDVHKKLSPNCGFVNGSGDGNMPIRSRGTDFVLSANSLTGLQDKDKTVAHCKINTENVNSNNINKNEAQPKLLSAIDRTGNLEQSRNDVNAWNAELGGKYSFTGTSCVQEKNKESQNTISSLSERPNGQRGMFQNNIKIAECIQTPKHQHFSVLTSRLESFRGWPSYLQQKPADMAAAGFYYVGVSDCVRCFFCGGGLRSWELGDDIWEEHARWYPACAFLKQCKGEDDVVLRQLAGINLRSNETLETESRESAASEKSLQNEICHVPLGFEAREVFPEDPMHCPSTHTVLSIGYNIEMVKKAVQMLITKKGHSEFSSMELMEVIFDLEENESNLQVSENTDHINDMAQVPAEVTVPNKSSGTKDANVDRNKQSSSYLQHRIHVEKEKNNHSPKGSLTSKEMESMLEQNHELEDQMICKICMEIEECIMFLLCCHVMTCAQCARLL